MATKYVARINGEIVGHRTTKDRTYTYAIVVDQSIGGWRADRGMHVVAWAGRSDLAAKEASKWSKYFSFVKIVPAELWQLKIHTT